MDTLRETQSAVQRAIVQGPQAIDYAIFSGPSSRVLLGLKAHANTVSHARLVALEETFPMTRDAVGSAVFNTVSRAFLDSGGGRIGPLAQIGRRFPDALISAGMERDFVSLARFEWAWLQSHHAAEADPVKLADLQGKSEAHVLLMPIKQHPAARIVANCRSIPESHIGDSLLLTRPAEKVQTRGIGAVEATLFAMAAAPSPLGDILANVMSEHPDGDVMNALLTLIVAGALCCAGDFKC